MTIRKPSLLFLVAMMMTVVLVVTCASGLNINLPSNPPSIPSPPSGLITGNTGSSGTSGSGSGTSGSNPGFGAYLSNPNVAALISTPIEIPGSVISPTGGSSTSGGSSASGGSQSASECKCGIGYQASGDPVDQTCKCTWVGVAAPKITPRFTLVVKVTPQSTPCVGGVCNNAPKVCTQQCGHGTTPYYDTTLNMCRCPKWIDCNGDAVRTQDPTTHNYYCACQNTCPDGSAATYQTDGSCQCPPDCSQLPCDQGSSPYYDSAMKACRCSKITDTNVSTGSSQGSPRFTSVGGVIPKKPRTTPTRSIACDAQLTPCPQDTPSLVMTPVRKKPTPTPKPVVCENTCTDGRVAVYDPVEQLCTCGCSNTCPTGQMASYDSRAQQCGCVQQPINNISRQPGYTGSGFQI